MIYLICGLGALAAIGAIAGCFRRYSRISVWGLSVVLTLVALYVTSTLVESGNEYYFYIVAGVCVGAFLIATAIFSLIGKVLSSARNAKREYNLVHARDDIEEAEAEMQSAIDGNDRREYRRNLKRKKKLLKVRTGAGGVVDVVLGGVSGAVNAAVAAFALISFFLMVSQMLTGVLDKSAFTDFIDEAVSSDFWVSFGKKIALDTLLVCLLCASFRVGFRSGISSFLCIVVVLGLIGGAGYSSYVIASGDVCSGLVTSISDGLLASLPEALSEFKPTIAIGIITAVLFVIMLVVIIIIGIFLPKLVDRLRDNKVFMGVDGIIGALLLLGVVFGLLMAVGGITYALDGTVEFDKLTSYTDASVFGNSLYKFNPLQNVFDAIVEFLKTGKFAL